MPTQEPTGIDLQDRVDFENEWNKIKQRYSNKKWFSDLQHIQDKDSLIKVIDNQRKRNVASDERSKLKAKVYKVMDALVNLLELYSPMFEALKQVNPHGVPAGGIIYGCFFVLVKVPIPHFHIIAHAKTPIRLSKIKRIEDPQLRKD